MRNRVERIDIGRRRHFLDQLGSGNLPDAIEEPQRRSTYERFRAVQARTGGPPDLVLEPGACQTGPDASEEQQRINYERVRAAQAAPTATPDLLLEPGACQTGQTLAKNSSAAPRTSGSVLRRQHTAGPRNSTLIPSCQTGPDLERPTTGVSRSAGRAAAGVQPPIVPCTSAGSRFSGQSALRSARMAAVGSGVPCSGIFDQFPEVDGKGTRCS